MKKLNCWEFMKCGREPGGINTEKLGVCPASVKLKAHGINSGKHGGRACWAIAGTCCGGNIQGTFAKKFHDCVKCPFYALVTSEEDRCLIGTEILKILEEEG